MLEKLIDISNSEKKTYFERRLVAEMKFAKMLSERENGKYDSIIFEAEEYVVESCGKDGIITREIMEKAEELLMPVSAAAKEYELMCAAHAHIDMNWQWGWDETVKIVIDTTRSILKIMEEYPEFKFSQSQASIYKILDDYAPQLLEEVKRRVKEGRWEVSASTWVEADKNMPNGESAVRQILYAKRYLSELLDLSMDDLLLDFEPDTFGHHANIPEILRNANIKYYYHCRGMSDCEYQLYRWKAPSGAEILVNRERNFYFVNVSPDMAFHAFSTSELTGVKETLHVYGVGDHGGGPTRRDVERLLDMNHWPIFPKFTLCTYREFFEAVESYRENLPVLDSEMNCIFDGCFTSQSRNKNGNRRSEEYLYKTEVFSALAGMQGMKYPHEKLEKSWRKVLLNQFHDIITGSGVRATREYALGIYQDVKAETDSMKNDAYGYLADRINTELIVKEEEISRNEPDLARAYGAGVGSGQVERGSGNTRIFHIFNPTAQERTENVEMLLWEWYGDPQRLKITDADGNDVEYQILEEGYNNYWYHNYQRLLIRPTVPGFGYTTIKLTEGKIEKMPVAFWWERRHQEKEELILENELLKVTFDVATAGISSVIDKKTGKELIDTTRESGIFQYILEANNKKISDWRSEMSSWLVGRVKNTEIVNRDVEVGIEHGKLRSTLSYTAKFHHSVLKTEVSLDKGSRMLKYKVECDWHEIGNEETGVPRLQFLMPVPYKNTVYAQDIPFGIQERKEFGTDTPSMSFTAAFGEAAQEGIAISSKNTYGYRCENDSVALALLRSSFDPDPYPENGICCGEFCVSFFENRMPNDELIHMFQQYNCGMDVVSGGRHAGSLPPKQSCLEAETDGAVISSVKFAENSEDLIVRIYDPDGKERKVSLDIKRPIHSAVTTDILERSGKTLETDGSKVTVTLQPHELTAVKIQL